MRVDGKINKPTFVGVDEVILLDGSASMGGLKYQNARNAILEEIKLCSQLGYTITVVEMIEHNKTITHCFKSDPSTVNIKFYGAIGGNTPLYDTVVSVFTNLVDTRDSSRKYLIKVWTDGQNNTGFKTSYDAEKAIKSIENYGNTVTFICTDFDKESVRRMGVDESNIITYNNTGGDLQKKLEITQLKTIDYSKRIAAGEDVTKGFYTKTLNN